MDSINVIILRDEFLEWYWDAHSDPYEKIIFYEKYGTRSIDERISNSEELFAYTGYLPIRFIANTDQLPKEMFDNREYEQEEWELSEGTFTVEWKF